MKEMNLDELITEIKEKIWNEDLSDEYLKEYNHSTRKEIGIGEYAYGITMIPCEWVLPFLEELQLAKEALKNKCEIADERNQLLVENQKLNKVIDDMARAINNYDSQLVINHFSNKEDVKQYFIKKVEEQE